MKEKISAITVIFVTAVFLVSCSVDTSNEEAQQKVDSIANAKLSAIQLMVKTNNDSIINAMAQARADSMLKKTVTPAK